jgi:ferrous-iron efflux pump FieF
MTFIQLHLELDDDMSLLDAHQICDEIEASLMAAFPESEIIIHIDPQSVVGIESVADFN